MKRQGQSSVFRGHLSRIYIDCFLPSDSSTKIIFMSAFWDQHICLWGIFTNIVPGRNYCASLLPKNYLIGVHSSKFIHISPLAMFPWFDTLIWYRKKDYLFHWTWEMFTRCCLIFVCKCSAIIFFWQECSFNRVVRILTKQLPDESPIVQNQLLFGFLFRH